MKHAVIENGVIVNIVLAEPDFASQMGWIAFPDFVAEKAVGIGWSYDGTNWVAPVEPVIPEPEPAPEVTVPVERI
jgi:hypothetical protein